MQCILQEVVTSVLGQPGQVLSLQQDLGCVVTGQWLREPRYGDRTCDRKEWGEPIGINHEHTVELVAARLSVELRDDLGHGGKIGRVRRVLEVLTRVELPVAGREVRQARQSTAATRKQRVERFPCTAVSSP